MEETTRSAREENMKRKKVKCIKCQKMFKGRRNKRTCPACRTYMNSQNDTAIPKSLEWGMGIPCNTHSIERIGVPMKRVRWDQASEIMTIINKINQGNKQLGI